MINPSKAALFVSAILATTPLFAQTNTTQTAQPVKHSPAYGDNPNIFVVLGHKTKEKVETTFSRIGNATERGVNKIKPTAQKTADIAEYSAEKTVDKTIDKTTVFAEKTKDFAEQTVEKTASGIENTTNKAKEAIFGNPEDKAPIIQHSLSQSSTDNPPKTFLDIIPAPQPKIIEPTQTATPQPEVQTPTSSDTPSNTTQNISSNNEDSDSSLPR